MRPGLVAVGGALALLGGGILLAVYWVPTPASTNQYSFTEPGLALPPGSTRSVVLNGINATPASVTVRWASTSPVSSTLYRELPCSPSPGPCPGPQVVSSWSGVRAGSWSSSGASVFPLLLTWTNSGSSPANLSVAWSETTSAPFHLPLLTAVLVDVGAAALVAIGALAVFLGLFLRGGVYRTLPPLVSRSAEDAEHLSGSTEPDRPRA